VLSEGKLFKIWRLKILVVNTVTNKVSRLLGKDETVRWMNLVIYQGQPAKKSLSTMVSIAGLQEIPNSLDVS
jgi:peptidylprolyl isomerase domain and WD repeat-containing protein 1